MLRAGCGKVNAGLTGEKSRSVKLAARAADDSEAVGTEAVDDPADGSEAIDEEAIDETAVSEGIILYQICRSQSTRR
jgi:hypothetical protein